MPRSNNTCNSRLPELWFNVALGLVTLISSVHAGEQKASAQTDTATPIENPPLPRPKPSIHDVTDENPAILISAFRHHHGEESVAISPVLTRIAQEQANGMAARGSLDHNALAPFSSRIGRGGHRANLLLHGAKWIGVAHAQNGRRIYWAMVIGGK